MLAKMFPVKHTLLTSVVCLSALCGGREASAQQVEPDDVAPMRDTSRLFVLAGPSVFSGQPGSVEDVGGQLLVGTPLWYSPAWGGVFQLSARAWGTIGVGGSKTLYVSALIGAGFELYLGRYLSIDTYVGPHVGVQAGDEVFPVLGFGGMGGWGLHPFEDVRKVLRLGISMVAGFPVGVEAAGNDCVACPSLGMTLGYETPF